VEPEPTDGTYVLRPEYTPQFNGDPKPDDVIQGELAACPLAAVLVAVAHANPKLLTNMITATTAVVVSTLAADSKFREVTSVLMTVQFRDTKPIEISRLLYYESFGDEDQPVFQIPYTHSDNGVSWVSFIEKAYVVLRGKNSYATLNLDRQLNAVQVMTDVVGPPLHVNLLSGRLLTPKGNDTKNEELSDKHLIAALKAAKQRPTIAASLDSIPKGSKIVANHGYGVISFDGKKVSLRNPHGGTDADVLISLGDFKKNFEAVLQAIS
jgi:hypothetical protein